MLRILVADDDTGLRLSVSEHLKKAGFEVLEAQDGQAAVELYQSKGADFVLLDVDMPNKDGLTALKEIKAMNPSVPVLMLTAYSNISDAVNAVKIGAYNYLSKPIAFEDLTKMIKRALEAKAMIQKIAFSAPSMKDEKTSLSVEGGREFLAKSDPMRRIFGLINRLAKVDTAVLIRGESGTGKELVARALHFNSPRKDGKFVAVNCSAISENLIESELFGHEKGAFTGASERKIGKFQYASGGTIFLDEIGDISPMMQVKLLRVLQEKKFTPVGSNRELDCDVRVVAATNRDLEAMISKREFREDLFYRLNVLPIFLPPLRERLEDIDMLTGHFIAQFNARHGREIKRADPRALAILKTWSWPGNIRELENVIEHCFVLEAGDIIMPHSLPKNILASLQAQAVLEREVSSLETEAAEKAAATTAAIEGEFDTELLDEPDESLGDEAGDDEDLDLAAAGGPAAEAFLANINDYHAFKEAMEKEFIVRALKASKGRVNQTARDAKIPKKTLLRKIAKYGINRKELVEDSPN